jgi:hypothetical protein
MEHMKEKLKLSIEFQYRTMKNGTILTIMDDKEIKTLEECLDVATKEELMDLIKVYHKEVKRIKLDIKEIIESE